MGRFENLAEMLGHLRSEQQARRTGRTWLVHEASEVLAIRRLAREAFGDVGVVEIDAHNPSEIGIGYFADMRSRPAEGQRGPRRTVIVFRGSSHAELAEQYRRALAAE